MQVTSTFWAATQQLPRGERATIPHMKEEMQGFHMNPISEIFFGGKALFSALSQSKGAAPRIRQRIQSVPIRSYPALPSAVPTKYKTNRKCTVCLSLSLSEPGLSHPLVVFCDPWLVALLVVERRLGEVSRDDALPLHKDGSAQRALVVRPHQHFRRLVGHLKEMTTAGFELRFGLAMKILSTLYSVV